MAVDRCLDAIAPTETPIEGETEGFSREFNWHCENGRATTYRCRSKGNVGGAVSAKVSVMKVLFDTNVLLDAMLAREPFVADAAFLLNAVESGRVEGFMSATTVTDVHYLVGRQTKSSEAAIAAVTRLLALMEICAVDREILEQAIVLGLPDFEDAVQIACAIKLELEAIVTRDVNGFAGSPIPVLSPQELRNRLL